MDGMGEHQPMFVVLGLTGWDGGDVCTRCDKGLKLTADGVGVIESE